MFALLGCALDSVLVHCSIHDSEVDLHHGTESLIVVLMLYKHVLILNFESVWGLFRLFQIFLCIHRDCLVIGDVFLEMLTLVNDDVLVVKDRVAYFDS
jgi:hypothetical protein